MIDGNLVRNALSSYSPISAIVHRTAAFSIFVTCNVQTESVAEKIAPSATSNETNYN